MAGPATLDLARNSAPTRAPAIPRRQRPPRGATSSSAARAKGGGRQDDGCRYESRGCTRYERYSPYGCGCGFVSRIQLRQARACRQVNRDGNPLRPLRARRRCVINATGPGPRARRPWGCLADAAETLTQSTQRRRARRGHGKSSGHASVRKRFRFPYLASSACCSPHHGNPLRPLRAQRLCVISSTSPDPRARRAWGCLADAAELITQSTQRRRGRRGLGTSSGWMRALCVTRRHASRFLTPC